MMFLLVSVILSTGVGDSLPTRGVSIQGISICWGVSVQGVLVQEEGVSVQGVSVWEGSLFRGVSVQGTPVEGATSVSMHPAGM